MEEHAFIPLSCEMLAHRIRPIFIITHNWKTCSGQMNTNLMCAPCSQFSLQPTVLSKTLFKRNNRVRPFPHCVDLDTTLTMIRQPFQQRLTQMLSVVDPIANDQSFVIAMPMSVTQHV